MNLDLWKHIEAFDNDEFTFETIVEWQNEQDAFGSYKMYASPNNMDYEGETYLTVMRIKGNTYASHFHIEEWNIFVNHILHIVSGVGDMHIVSGELPVISTTWVDTFVEKYMEKKKRA